MTMTLDILDERRGEQCQMEVARLTGDGAWLVESKVREDGSLVPVASKDVERKGRATPGSVMEMLGESPIDT